MKPTSTTNDDLKAAMLRIMHQYADCDLNVKMIRKLVEEEFECDLSNRKLWVRETVHALIAQHFSDDNEGNDLETGLSQQSTGEEVEIENGVSQGAGDVNDGNEAGLDSVANPFEITDSKVGVRLVVPPKLPRGQSMIVQLDDSMLEFQNDTGVIGRVSVQKRSLTMDLKGHQFTAYLRPCATLLVVGVTGDRAKVETLVDEFCELSGRRNVVEQMSGVLVRGSMASASESSGDNAGLTRRRSTEPLENRKKQKHEQKQKKTFGKM